MAERYAISPIIGSGTITDPYRAAVADVGGVNTAAVIPSDANGHPLYRFALAIVAASQWAQVLAVTNLYLFPDYVLDGLMSGMDPTARSGLVQSVQAYDLTGQGTHLDATNADTDSYRTLLTKIGQQFDPNFSLNAFGVSDVTQ